ncbi:hypothetical protein O181_048756 [Austropuccinia psidii MF-1]|uniref:Uncharacterized protein n=1 Tax=Austropuccinia psidii MF-1 TaxID=1389203 RepID=A0A9Q3DR87_9BASI|nr:hypothetical protein [Austropuccinia psidii MF-1]
MLLGILKILQHPQNDTMILLLRCPQGMPLTLTLPLLIPSPTPLILSVAYHFYTHEPPQVDTMMPPPISALTTPYALAPAFSSPPFTIFTLPWCPQDMPPTPPSPPLHLLQPTANHPYSHLLDP